MSSLGMISHNAPNNILNQVIAPAIKQKPSKETYWRLFCCLCPSFFRVAVADNVEAESQPNETEIANQNPGNKTIPNDYTCHNLSPSDDLDNNSHFLDYSSQQSTAQTSKLLKQKQLNLEAFEEDSVRRLFGKRCLSDKMQPKEPLPLEFMIEELQKKHIAAVDDSLTNLKMIGKKLLNAKIPHSLFSDGREIVAHLQDMENPKKIDAILMDLSMKYMGGLEATETLRLQGINTPIIAWTTEERTAIVDCQHSGMNGFCSKIAEISIIITTLYITTRSEFQPTDWIEPST